jgi:hypothetical protein
MQASGLRVVEENKFLSKKLDGNQNFGCEG